MQETIGNAAGQVWEILSQKDSPVNVADLPKLTKLKAPVAYQALGWLAREGKIEYSQKGSKTFLSLTPADCWS